MEAEGDLNNILEKVPLRNLLQSIQAKAESAKKDIVGYIRGIFLCSTLKNDECEKRRYETFKCVLSLLQNQNLPTNIASELEAVLLLKVDSLQTSNLMKLTELFIEHARNNHSSKGLELFSKILSCLSHRDTIVYNGTDMSGVELRKNILSSLFSSNSNIPGIVQLASVLKDVDLSENEMELIAEKLLELLPEVELIEQPPFIYQLLLLSAKGKRRQILQGIISYFIQKDNRLRELANNNEDSDSIDDENQTLYRQTEGTVILMISVSSRHDQSIEKEFLHLIKQLQHKPEIILSPFSLATSLSLSKMHHGVNNIFDSLKKSLVLAFQLKEKRNNSVWLRNLIPCTSDILELTKEAIKSSEYGWDHICQGLVKFGFAALDAFGPKYVLGNVIKTVSEEGCRLGSQILRDTFKSHRIVRIEIFEQLLNRIIAKAQRPIFHYIDILSQIVQND
ncbi:Fanconi anemia group I protein-like protein, partial [Stegodyphus mimosarum]